MTEDNRNLLIFGVCAAILFVIYQVYVIDPQAKRRQAELKAHPPAAAAVMPGAPAMAAPPAVTRAAALATSPRVPIETPALKGSISLRGARLDDLFLTRYRQTTAKDSPPVEMLRPEGAAFPWFVDFGWVGQNVPGLPSATTVWTLTQGTTLSPGHPVVMTYSNGQGLTFARRVDVDENYMFKFTDTVTNTGAGPVTLAPYGSVQRQGVPPEVGKSGIVHEGTIGYLDGRVRSFKYKDLSKKGAAAQEFNSVGGWTGITDKYWLASLIPNASEQIHAVFRDAQDGDLNVFEANYTGGARTIAPGQQVSVAQHLFAGAKVVPLLKAYQTNLAIPHFDEAVDWGMFWFFTRPIFAFLEYIFAHVGSFGIAILLLTVCVRVAFFPIANKQYESMTKMKKVQPLMEDLRKRYKDDPAKQQQEIMALYQREKVNPLAGCLPILLQIPVFFSLYKVLSVTIEMRHAPFMGWINDLSARDPTTIWNLFGLIPWNPAHLPLVGGILDTTLHLGILPLAYGITMWLTTSMTPQTGVDPAQQKIFQLMPWVFMFIMAPFAVGLLIYWTWSNVLTTVQQYVMMRRFKVENPIDKFFARVTGKAAG
ncbi:membrane protein insertase YidC [Phenylobacterium sp.]|jgi:YidC/Oxa1 family membrane protein insertase|uniref:membrane protein insertase YidC n=1 Tax=Phenylobacterium sp. TaxID=1871053 RepID=UPI002F42949B